MKYAQILTNLEDIFYEPSKQLDVESCVKGLVHKYYVQGFPLEAKEFEMRVYQFINHSNINNRSKVSCFICLCQYIINYIIHAIFFITICTPLIN